MTRVFITGAGMIGCHAARELASAGHDVILFDLAPRERYILAVAGDGVEVVRGDIRELPVLLAAIRAFGPDVLVHTAALIGGAAAEQLRDLLPGGHAIGGRMPEGGREYLAFYRPAARGAEPGRGGNS